MKKLYLLIFTVLLIVSASVALVQRDFSKIELKVTKVAGNIYLISGMEADADASGGNIAVSIGEDGVLMVDAKFAPLSDKVKAAIQEVGGDAPKFLINTHKHGDHVGGNPAFSQSGTIFAHDNVRKRVITEQDKEAWPVITFDSSMSFHVNGEEIQAIHYPEGHTDGDAVVFFKGSNVIHMGDHFFKNRFPYIDINSGGTLPGYMDNVKKVIESAPADVKIIPGHGSLSTLDDLKAFHQMMQETTTFVTDKMKSGKSLKEIKSEGLPEKYASFGSGFINTEKWIETIYNSFPQLTKK